jgi:uncharacterized protein YodC (DUF2158 family)
MTGSGFKEGDVVRLKSGGPAMVIESIIAEHVATCVWFSEERKLNAFFVLATLQPAPKTEASQGGVH